MSIYGFHICPAPPTLTIYRPGKPETDRAAPAVLFEMHSYCGPMPVDRNGNGRTLAGSHWFWHRVSQWAQQGEKVDELGRCLYDPEVPLHGEEPPPPGAIVLPVGTDGPPGWVPVQIDRRTRRWRRK